MIKVKQDVNNKRVFMQIKAIEHNYSRSIRRAFYKAGKNLTKEARRSIIKGPKTGRYYRVSGRRRRHRASAPGEPPANLSGNLQRSIDFIVKGSKEMEFGAGSNDLLYARPLELGNDRIKQRSYLLRAINEKEKDTERYFENELTRNLNTL